MGEVLVSAAARPAARIGPRSGKGSPARISHEAAASAAAADPLGILLTITLGALPGFITQHSFGAATGPPSSTGRPSLAAAGTAADTAAVAATGSTTAGSTAAICSMAGAGDRSLAGSAAGPTAAGSATVAAELTAGTGGVLSLALTSTPDGPGMASSSSAISPFTWLPSSGAEAAGLAPAAAGTAPSSCLPCRWAALRLLLPGRRISSPS